MVLIGIADDPTGLLAEFAELVAVACRFFSNDLGGSVFLDHDLCVWKHKPVPLLSV